MVPFLGVIAGVSWGAAIAADAVRADDRVWLPLLGAALLASWAAVQARLIDRASDAASAMTRAVLTRPFSRGDSGPMPAIPLQLAGNDGPPRPSAAGRHAARRASR